MMGKQIATLSFSADASDIITVNHHIVAVDDKGKGVTMPYNAERAAVRRFLSRYLVANEQVIRSNTEHVIASGSTCSAIKGYRIGRGSGGGNGADHRKGYMQSGPLGVLEKCSKKELVQDLVKYVTLQSGDDVGGKRLPGYLAKMFWQQKRIRNKSNLPDIWRRLVHDVEKEACGQLGALRIEKQKAMIPALVEE